MISIHATLHVFITPLTTYVVGKGKISYQNAYHLQTGRAIHFYFRHQRSKMEKHSSSTRMIHILLDISPPTCYLLLEWMIDNFSNNCSQKVDKKLGNGKNDQAASSDLETILFLYATYFYSTSLNRSATYNFELRLII